MTGERQRLGPLYGVKTFFCINKGSNSRKMKAKKTYVYSSSEAVLKFKADKKI